MRKEGLGGIMKKIFFLFTISTLLMAILINCNKDISVKGVIIDETFITLGVGKTKTLIATILPEKATNKLVTWESSDTTVASVTSSGQVTAHSRGEATIVVTTIDGSFTANCKVIVSVPQPSKDELISQEKGWILSSAVSFPAFVSYSGIVDENLFVSFFYECELDDIMYFKKNGTQTLNFGKNLCDGQTGKEISLGNWRITKDRNVLEFYLPYFFDEYDNFFRLEGELVILDKNTLQIRIPLVFDNGLKKGNRVLLPLASKSEICYEFTLTYRKAI